IRAYFDVDEALSKDAVDRLGPREFGYRSVHVIVTARSASVGLKAYSRIAGMWFEIQIRSLLQHGWAQVDHEAVYKGGIVYPDDIRRQWAAVAGSLEILDNRFVELRGVRDDLIDETIGRPTG